MLFFSVLVPLVFVCWPEVQRNLCVSASVHDVMVVAKIGFVYCFVFF